MKGKKQRKNLISNSPLRKLNKLQVPPLTKIKFNLSMDNLSCFISEQKTMKKCLKRTSQSIKKNRKSSQKYQKEGNRSDLKKKESVSKRKVQASPDISIQLSNTIISNIEKRGINCPWNQTQQNTVSKGEQDQLSNQEIWTVFSNQFNKSYASTNDFHHYQNYTYSNYQTNRTKSDSLTFTIQIQNIGNDLRTTVMIRNIPNKYTISELAEEIDQDHANSYDFLYLPCDFNNFCNVGYGFINFTSTEHLKSFYCKFQHYVWRKYKSEKICALTYARLQGLNQLIQHFENSKVLNQKEKKYRPIIKYDKIHQMVLAQQRK